MDKYDAVDIHLIQFMYVKNNSFPSLRLKNINKELLDKEIVNVKETKELFNNKFLPLSNNEIYYGKPLTFEVDSTKEIVTSLYVNEIDFITILKQKCTERNIIFTPLSSKIRFYLYTINNQQYIITVNDLEGGRRVKEVYNLSGFKILADVIDQEISKNKFIRNIKNISIEFEENTVTRKNIQVKLPILKLKPTKYTNAPNPKIGSLDLETFRDTGSNSKVYAIGFSNLSMLKTEIKSNMYYLTRDGTTSKEIIIKCINEMLTPKHRDHIYYVHNLGGFDIVFLLNALKETNKEKGMEYYKIKTIFRDSKVLKCSVMVKTPSGYNKITLIDSYNLLIDNLDNLSKAFGSNTKKGVFPYTFVTSNTLNYKGNTPPIDYYKIKNKIISSEKYKLLYKSD
jgi:hypothetical protein